VDAFWMVLDKTGQVREVSFLGDDSRRALMSRKEGRKDWPLL
jgi:hypothetical protein